MAAIDGSATTMHAFSAFVSIYIDLQCLIIVFSIFSAFLCVSDYYYYY